MVRYHTIPLRARATSDLWIDDADYSGGAPALHLVPEGAALKPLAQDHRHMVDDGLLLEDAETFDELIERCREIELQANNAFRLSQ